MGVRGGYWIEEELAAFGKGRSGGNWERGKVEEEVLESKTGRGSEESRM